MKGSTDLAAIIVTSVLVAAGVGCALLVHFAFGWPMWVAVLVGLPTPYVLLALHQAILSRRK
jgi:uncharacterized protein (DUF983 family)